MEPSTPLIWLGWDKTWGIWPSLMSAWPQDDSKHYSISRSSSSSYCLEFILGLLITNLHKDGPVRRVGSIVTNCHQNCTSQNKLKKKRIIFFELLDGISVTCWRGHWGEVLIWAARVHTKQGLSEPLQGLSSRRVAWKKDQPGQSN